jgi:Mn-dependent DtxR family transcriptional regulator
MGDDIIRFLKDNPGSSRGKIAAYIGVEGQKLSVMLATLKRDGKLTMTGSRKGAKWSAA